MRNRNAIVIDACIIVFAIQIANQGQETSMLTAAIIGIAIGIGSAFCGVYLGDDFGVFVFAPMVLVAIGVIWVGSSIPLGRAAYATRIYFCMRFLFGMAWALVLGR